MRGKPTITDIMMEYMSKQKTLSTTGELTVIIKNRRPDLKSKDLPATIRSILQRDSSFKRIRPGVYDVNR